MRLRFLKIIGAQFSRVGLLKSAEENNWLICTGHLSDSKAIGRIVSNNNKIAWEPIQI